MRALRFAFVAAAVAGVSLSALSFPAFARGAAGAGASGGGASGGSSGGAGGGSNPNLSTLAVIPGDRGGPPRFVRLHSLDGSSCYKHEQLFDRYGFAVVDLHGANCFE